MQSPDLQSVTRAPVSATYEGAGPVAQGLVSRAVGNILRTVWA